MAARNELQDAIGDIGNVSVPSREPRKPWLAIDAKNVKQKIRVRKMMSLNKHVGLAAGFDVTCATGEVKPSGQLIFRLPVVKNDVVDAFNVNVSDKRVSVTGRFRVPLGVLSVKGHGRIGVNYAGRKPYVGVDVVPTRAPTVALGATTALFAGKKLSASPHLSLTKNVGLDLGIQASKDAGGPVKVSLEDAALTIKL